MSKVQCVFVLATVWATASPAAGGPPDRRVVESVRLRDSQALAALLRNGADVNVPSADGATALHWAAHWNDIFAARKLLTAGARVNVTNDYGVTPLFMGA